MTSFEAHTPALSSGAAAFGNAFSPLFEQAARLESLKGSSSTTGRDYSVQGDSYHQAMTGPVQELIKYYAQKCNWVSYNLSANAKDYEARDAANTAAIKEMLAIKQIADQAAA